MKPGSEWLREIYTDESYIHHHHRLQNNDLYHPEHGKNEPESLHKGRRFCLVTAMVGRSTKEPAGLIKNSLLIFSPSSKKNYEGDYRKVFNRTNYVQWFK